MHAIMYRTEVARASGMMLPEHTFYVDNIYDYHPLPYVKTICYLPVVLYHYFVGRADQSVSLKNTVARYAQQQKVTLCMTDAYSYKEIKNQPKRLKKYLLRLLSYSAINVLVFTGLEYSKERKQSLKDFWKHIKQNDKKLYRKLRYRSLASLISFLPWHFRAWCMRIGYNISNKKTKFD
jgi:hypothetical protein